MTGRLEGRGTNFQVWFCINALNSSCIAAIHSGCLDAEMKVTGSGEKEAEVWRRIGSGYLVDYVALTESTVCRISESRLVLTSEGEMCESRFEGESGLVEGIWLVTGILDWSALSMESFEESRKSWLDESWNFGEWDHSCIEVVDTSKKWGVERMDVNSVDGDTDWEVWAKSMGAGDDPRSSRVDKLFELLIRDGDKRKNCGRWMHAFTYQKKFILNSSNLIFKLEQWQVEVESTERKVKILKSETIFLVF